jgi:hypothetical protein
MPSENEALPPDRIIANGKAAEGVWRKLETGNWKPETGNWKLETGN